MALCHGLIEAGKPGPQVSTTRRSIPWRCATASLKLGEPVKEPEFPRPYSVALCHGLIEASSTWGWQAKQSKYSVALCHGLIEA